jgi:hypothetical protein
VDYLQGQLDNYIKEKGYGNLPPPNPIRYCEVCDHMCDDDCCDKEDDYDTTD